MRIRKGFNAAAIWVFTLMVSLILGLPGYGFLYDVDEDFRLGATSGMSGCFGQSVAVSGDRALAGAYKTDDLGENSGSAYVFRFDGSTWVEEAKLLPSDGAAMHHFGCAVSLDGNAAVVGTYENDYQGSAYVFRFDGEEWTEEAKLLSPDPDVNEHFGHSVSIEGDTVLVGAYLDDLSSPGNGAAYVFRHDGSNWILEAELTASDSATCYWFGTSVCLSAGRALVGANGDTENGMSAGAAYLFRPGERGWIEEAKLLASDGASGDQLGGSVALSGDVALVGADYADAAAGNSGSAYIFRRSGSVWSEEAKLIGSDVGENDHFGRVVAIDGDTTVVGTYPDNHANERAFVFSFDGGGWVEVARLRPSLAPVSINFGMSASVEGDAVLIGATAAHYRGEGFMFWNWHKTMDCDFSCEPASGTLPFVTQMGVRLTNNYVLQKRRIAARIRVNLAGGQQWSSWKSGYTQLDPGQSYINFWSQNLPAYPSLLGANLFTLTAEDITPFPYNQPPYVPAGDNDTEVCAVTGIAP